MAEIAQVALDFSETVPDAWLSVAGQAHAWAAREGVALRDAVLLVPLVHHLAPARAAFGRLGGWLPRIETVRTLVAGRPPVAASAEDAVSFDVARDRLRAAQLLRGQDWGRRLAKADAHGFAQTVHRFVDAAHALARRQAACAPQERAAWGGGARAMLVPSDGPGQTERLLARLALEWVLASGPWPTDALFSMQPVAWIALKVGGLDPLVQAVMQSAAAPCRSLLLDADPSAPDPLQRVPDSTVLQQVVCADFEDEAQRAAAQLLALLQAGQAPLALIAQDRLLVRRVSALLARRQVPVADETGWKLSTTRAAAGVMALLRAASSRASADDVLDWLKALPLDRQQATAADGLERRLRRQGGAQREALRTLSLDGAAGTLRDEVLRVLSLFDRKGNSDGGPVADDAGDRASLAEWMERLRQALLATGQWRALQDDDAGRQVLAALRLDSAEATSAWRSLSAAVLRFEEFVQAVDEVLEQAAFEPPLPDAPPQVVITPLRRALLRPFAAAVFPGADDRRLGVPAAPEALLGDALSSALGLPTAAQREREEAVALVQLLRLPQIVFLHRRDDDGEALGASVLLERLAALCESSGRCLVAPPDPRPVVPVTSQAVTRAAPIAVDRLPTALSASLVEALRDCPYRFFSRGVLRLQEADELDDEAEKRDYGTWLHDVLLRFHEQRPEPRTVEQDLAALQHWAQVVRQESGFDAASFLPFEASFQRFAPHYAQWLQGRDASGARWIGGERDRVVTPVQLHGMSLRGRIDRIDQLGGEHRGVRQLLDYKTASVASLRERVKEPLEDTQLAFYAALEMLGDEPPEALDAIYLALDDSGGIIEIRHPDVADTAQQLVDALAGELARVRGGAALPALGEGSVCEYCEARGLCRRDHWSEDKR